MHNFLHPSNDLALSQDESQRFFPAVIALLVAVAIVFSVVGLAAGTHLEHRKALSQHSVSVYIPYETTNDALTLKVKERLMQESARLTQLSQAALKERLKPWMSGMKSDAEWPLPTVFQLEYAAEPASTAKLAAALQALDSTIRVDSGTAWAGAYSRTVAVIQSALLALAGLIGVGLVLVTVYVARTSMRLHQEAVAVLHGMGAEDGYIVKQFERQALALAISGAAKGAAGALGLLGLAALALSFGNINVTPTFSWSYVAALVILPLLACATACIATRLSVKNVLRQLP